MNAQDLADVIAEAITTATKPLHARISALEGKAGSVSWRGTFDENQTYRIGDLITRSGGLWLTVRPPADGDLPGNSAAFKLIVRRGSYDREDSL